MNRKPGLYVHVPFCSAICPYCDFAVVTGGRDRRKRYLEHLLSEIDGLEPLGYDTLYFGGGTPSLLDADDLRQIRERTPVSNDCHVSLEANPEDVTETSVAAWRELGVETLSLGVQAFDDEALAFLGRRHSAADARRAIEVARRGGFTTLSIDLIFGLPGQSARAWRRALEVATGHGPDHISCYQLTVHDDTLFGRNRREGKLVEAPNEQQAELFRETHRVLADAGYEGYEVSNFARGAEHRSRHNTKYWEHIPYRGIGPSAHSFDGRTRWWNLRSLFAWQERLDSGERPIEGEEKLSDDELLLETVMLGLRTRDGLDLDVVRARFGVELVECNRALVSRLCDQGFVELSGSRLRPTLEGLAIADSLATAFELKSERWSKSK